MCHWQKTAWGMRVHSGLQDGEQCKASVLTVPCRSKQSLLLHSPGMVPMPSTGTEGLLVQQVMMVSNSGTDTAGLRCSRCGTTSHEHSGGFPHGWAEQTQAAAPPVLLHRSEGSTTNMRPLYSPLCLVPAGQAKRSWAQSWPQAPCHHQWLQARKVLSLSLHQHKRGHHRERIVRNSHGEILL